LILVFPTADMNNPQEITAMIPEIWNPRKFDPSAMK